MWRLKVNALRFGVFLASTAITIALVELGLRVVGYPPDKWSPWVQHDATGFAYAPNLSQRWTTDEYDIVYRTNTQGFRDDEIGEKERFRILLLGDSFASGYGIHREEQFADLLEDQLNIDIVNAATGGWELEHQYYFFMTRGKALEPDLVLYAMYLGNDILNNGYRPRDENGLKPDARGAGKFEKSFKLALLYRRVRHAFEFRQGLTRKEWKPWPEYLKMCEVVLRPQARRFYRSTRKFLRKLRDGVRDDGSDLVVAFFSYRTVVEAEARERFMSEKPGHETLYDLDRPAREIEAQLRELGIRYVDLNEVLRAANAGSPSPPLYYIRDGHWTARAHRLVAARLRDVLEPMIDRP